MTHVKVCGLRRREDVQTAVALGAAAIGFVFWPESPRAVTVDDAEALTRELPPFVSRVGVFVNQPVEAVSSAVQRARLTAVQLHGDEDAAEYRACGVPVIRAVGVHAGFDAGSVGTIPADVTILLDAHDPVRRGGTGKVIDWTAAAGAARLRRVILSGGLTPDNVAAAVAAVRPYGVDVSSGVERAPGIKDEAKLRAFFAAVRA